MTWRQVVRRELARYREQTGSDFVDRQEFLSFARPVFESEYPDASTPGQTFSRVMQDLRDRGEVDFVDGAGTYRILDLDADRAPERAGERDSGPEYTAREYETTVGARSMPAAFREYVLDQYGRRCPVSAVDHDRLLDVAHVLSWADHPERRTDPANVLPLSKTHHAAFDAGLFTLDTDYRLRIAPDFETESETLTRTLVEQSAERIDVGVAPEYLDRHNETLDWW